MLIPYLIYDLKISSPILWLLLAVSLDAQKVEILMKFDLFFPLLPVPLVSDPGNNSQSSVIKAFPRSECPLWGRVGPV